jgi:hypothetical protein
MNANKVIDILVVIIFLLVDILVGLIALLIAQPFVYSIFFGKLSLNKIPNKQQTYKFVYH